MDHERIRRIGVERRGEQARVADDAIAVEEPLEIRILGKAVSVVMRTPGDDYDLAVGFVVTEGIVDREDISAVANCSDAAGAPAPNVVNVSVAQGVAVDWARFQRNMYTSSSCGICGKATLDQVEVLAPPVIGNITITDAICYELPGKCRGAQRVFDETGGLHAAALFNKEGKLILAREDIGRHNAVDKIVGSRVRAGEFDMNDTILFVSGRAGFEIIQKARVAGIPIVAAVGAPSSLAVECALAGNMTLVGFLRDGGFNIYSRPERICK